MKPKSDIPLTWGEEVRAAIAFERLDLGNTRLEQEIRKAYSSGRVFRRQLNVDYSAIGQGMITGFE